MKDDNKKTAGLSFVHIEDEYIELKSLVFTVKTLIEDFYEENDLLLVARSTLIEESEHEWLVYEIQLEIDPDSDKTLPENPPVFRYALIRSEVIPDRVKELLLQDRIFILDVLRPDNDARDLEVSVEKSIASVESIMSGDDQIVFYTAYNGQGLDEATAGPYQKFSKSDPTMLDLYLSEKIQEFIEKNAG